MSRLLVVFLLFLSCCASIPTKVTIDVNEINTVNVDRILAKMKAIEFVGVEEVWFRITSHGGSVDEGYQLIDAIERYHVPTVCVIDFYGESMAAYIEEACDRSLITQRSFIMFHGASLGINEKLNEDQLKSHLDWLMHLNDSLAQYVSDRSGMDKKFFKLKTKRNWYLSPDEALKLHLVDGIITQWDIPESI